MISRTMNEVREQQVDYLLVVMAAIAVPALLVSLSRVALMGWLPPLVFQTALLPAVLLVALFRRDLSCRLKISFVLAALLGLAIFSMVSFSLSAFATEALILAVLVAAIFLSRVQVLGVAMVALLSFALMGWLWVEGSFTRPLLDEARDGSLRVWILSGLGLIIIMVLVSQIIYRLRIHIDERMLKLEHQLRRYEATLKDLDSHLAAHPICPRCHRVRGADKTWAPLEQHLKVPSPTTLTPKICPQCVGTMPDHMPE